MDISAKKIAVVGLGKSNISLLRFLRKKYPDLEITACDQKSRSELDPVLSRLDGNSLELKTGSDYLDGLEDYDLVFATPGLPGDLPELERAQAAGTEITTEMELFFTLCPAPILGVTGSNGKSTTTALLGEILKKSNPKTYVGGNIGQPLIECVDEIDSESLVVLELSSFQLEKMDHSPHIGILLNISPNHLDIHSSMDEYVRAKKNIFRFQRKDDWVVLNRDDRRVYSFRREAPGQVAAYSLHERVSSGVYVKEGKIWSEVGGRREKIATSSDISLPGKHNLSNALAAIAAAQLAGATPEQIRSTLSGFQGLAHRLEFVGEWKGVRYYNDSVATTPESTVAALDTFSRPILLLAGGYDKKVSMANLAAKIVESPVRVLLLVGETKRKIADAVISEGSPQELPAIVDCRDLREALQEASSRAVPGDIVLLSPACASYDMFDNFEQRGEIFRKLVPEIAETD